MSNDPEHDEPRFYYDLGQDGYYWIHDRDERIKAQGPFFDMQEAREHCRELYRIYK